MGRIYNSNVLMKNNTYVLENVLHSTDVTISNKSITLYHHYILCLCSTFTIKLSKNVIQIAINKSFCHGQWQLMGPSCIISWNDLHQRVLYFIIHSA